MINELQLQQDRFIDKTLTGLKQKNMIFGKNGTGKSSITEAISDQYSEKYDLRIFQGFHRIIKENGSLNTIALGKKNVELQPKIDEQNKLVTRLDSDTSVPKIEGDDNTFSKFEKAKKEYQDLFNKIEFFYTQAASKIKNDYTYLTGANYDKRHFKQDIEALSKFINNNPQKNQDILNQNTIINDKKIKFIEPDIGNFLEAVNEIISKNITESAIISFQSTEIMNWVKDGLSLLANEEECAFCGSKLSKQRIDNLNSCFNDEVKLLEDRIEKAIIRITDEIRIIKDIKKIDITKFYPEFHLKIHEINDDIEEYKNRYLEFYAELLSELKKRKKDIFIPIKVLEISPPKSFNKIIQSYDDVFQKNILYSEKLEKLKESAREELRKNQVYKQLDFYNYHEKISKLNKLKEYKNKAEKTFNYQREELIRAKENLSKLLSQTIDESIAAENINKSLKVLGNQSFTLVRVDENDQKGQYQVKGYDGNIRNIDSLSTGEKNIVAFLWFVLNLENQNHLVGKDMIVVFDDPMNSNDDTVQYLIISKLQMLLKNIGTRQIFILTHNSHFYLNLRYKWWVGSNKNNYDKTTFHLLKCGNKSNIKLISRETEDISTSYGALWKEVRWLYDQKKPDFMLNPLRRILETYQKFNGIKNMYFEDVESQKLFHVNSHSIDDFEVDLNGKDEIALMNKVKELFESNNAKSHFEYYWKDGE